MKLATIMLASAFALSSTFVFADTKQHKSGAKAYHGTVGMSSAQKQKQPTTTNYNRSGGCGPNGCPSGGTGGLVGGFTEFEYKP